MLKKILAVIAISMSGYGINAAAEPGFTEVDWEGVPSPGELTVDDVMGLFVEPIERGGRKWTLGSFDNDDFKAVIGDGQFEVRQIEDEELFAHQQFKVDSAGVLKYEMFLVSLTKTYEREAGDGDEEFYRNARLPITTQLTPEELMNPIIRAVQSDKTFEEESRFARENIEEYQRTVGLRDARQLLMFVHADRVDEVAAMLAEEAAGIE